jgi:hypothetical protein
MAESRNDEPRRDADQIKSSEDKTEGNAVRGNGNEPIAEILDNSRVIPNRQAIFGGMHHRMAVVSKARVRV